MSRSSPSGPVTITGDSSNPVIKELHFKKTDGTYAVGPGLDPEDNLTWGHALAVKPTWQPIVFNATLAAQVTTTKFHIFGTTGEIKAITEIHGTAEGSALTAYITKDKDGTAPGAGVTVMSGTFDLNGTAVTKQTATLSSATDTNTGMPAIRFKSGDSLSWKQSAAGGTCAGVLCIVWVQFDLPVIEVSWYSAAVTSQDQRFFIANTTYAGRSIRATHATAETTDTTANYQVTHDTGTDAAGAGTNLVTFDSTAGFDLNATANTVQTATMAAFTMQGGDRLSVDFDSTQTQGAGACVTVTLSAHANRIEVPYWLHDTNVTDFFMFDAIRDCYMWDVKQLHGVAAGGASTLNLEKARGTTAASSGTAMLATAFDLNATADTTQTGEPVTFANSRQALLTFVSGDRMSGDYANTEQSMVGLVLTASFMMM